MVRLVMGKPAVEVDGCSCVFRSQELMLYVCMQGTVP